jgi:hypothetical protein
VLRTPSAPAAAVVAGEALPLLALQVGLVALLLLLLLLLLLPAAWLIQIPRGLGSGPTQAANACAACSAAGVPVLVFDQ